jgi:DnaJ domain
MNRRKHPDVSFAPPCDVNGCSKKGEYKAPKHRDSRVREYHFFCLEHVRAFNKSYNFFDGMDDDRVQAFMKDAVTGHRPTWRMGNDHRLAALDLEESIQRFFGWDSLTNSARADVIPAVLRSALEVFALSYPTDYYTIKKSYKQLVKRYHPDVNKEQGAAEKFKEIMDSYRVLIEHYPNP